MTDQFTGPVHYVYLGFDRKPCHVLLDDGAWVDAEIRTWDRDAEGNWTVAVMWSSGPGQGNHLERFREEQVRPVAPR